MHNNGQKKAKKDHLQHIQTQVSNHGTSYDSKHTYFTKILMNSSAIQQLLYDFVILICQIQ